jgi:hypothetical protein
MSFLRLMEETINETEQSADPEIPPVHELKKRTMGSLLREMWPAYLIEILVIILGITITLGLEAWRESVKERKLEHIYLENLRSDISLDRTGLAHTQVATEKLLQNGVQLLSFIGEPGSGKISTAELTEKVRSILSRPNFRSHDVTFSELKSSGNLHLIENPELKNLLFAYYRQTENIRTLQDGEQQATIALSGSFFLKNFPFQNFGKSNSDSVSIFAAAKTTEFLNNVLLRVSNRRELLEIYVTADSTIRLLEKALTAD